MRYARRGWGSYEWRKWGYGESIKEEIGKKGKTDWGAEMVKALKPTGREIDTNGKNGKADKCGKTVRPNW